MITPDTASTDCGPKRKLMRLRPETSTPVSQWPRWIALALLLAYLATMALTDAGCVATQPPASANAIAR